MGGDSQREIERDRKRAEERDRRKKMLANVDDYMAKARDTVAGQNPRTSIAFSLLAFLTIARMHERFNDDD